jgi:hypothetical protein
MRRERLDPLRNWSVSFRFGLGLGWRGCAMGFARSQFLCIVRKSNARQDTPGVETYVL